MKMKNDSLIILGSTLLCQDLLHEDNERHENLLVFMKHHGSLPCQIVGTIR